jgi:putative FmdB family regulatory protein
VPTYEYACKQCDKHLDVVQSFTDDELTDCPSCEGGQLRKVFSAAGIIFKGSGWHIKDYGDKKKPSTSTTADTKSDSSVSSSPSDASSSSSEPKTSSTGNVKTFDTKASKAGAPKVNAPKKSPSKAASTD